VIEGKFNNPKISKMKKIIIVLAIVFSAGILSGCADEEVLPVEGDGTIEPIGDRR